MPYKSKRAPSSRGRREIPLQVLIREHGGVSGVSRKIIFRWKGTFNKGQIHNALIRQHPRLIPAPTQLGDLLEHLERRKWIACVAEDQRGKNYIVAPKPAQPIPVQKLRQLTFEYAL